MTRDYTGKIVYVGIDVHKKNYVVHCICDNTKVKSWTMQANNESLISQLKQFFPGAGLKTVYEAGFSGYVLHRSLEAAGIKNLVVNPGSIEVASRDKVKTDKRDAKKLAEQLSRHQLTSIYIPNAEEELARLPTRLRAELVKERGRTACRIKSKLMQFGLMDPDDDKAASKRWIQEVQRGSYPLELNLVLEHECRMWLQFDEKIEWLDREIAKASASNPVLSHREQIYKSAPGIGDISAQELSRELGDMSQFSSKKKMYSFTGLTPSESSSGEKVRRGSISQCGRPRIRHLLVEIAWRSIRKDKLLADKFTALSIRRGKKRAIVAIARILIGRLRACLLAGEFYKMTEITKQV